MVTPTAEHARALNNIARPNGAELIIIGRWRPDTTWGFYRSNQLPDGMICTAAAAVAIRNLATSEVILTLNPKEDQPERIAKWEIPGGHLDPIHPEHPESPLEGKRQATVRELVEEGGVKTAQDHLRLFGYRLMLNPPGSEYPVVSCMAYYYDLGSPDLPLVRPTDPSKPIAAIFPEGAPERLVDNKMMDAEELTIVQYGLTAARQDHMRGTAWAQA